MSPIPEPFYRSLSKHYKNNIPLGHAYFVEFEHNKFISNMIAQIGIKPPGTNPCLIDYDALKTCLLVTFQRALLLNLHVHMPSGIGSGLAGGDKKIIHNLIFDTCGQISSNAKEPLNITLWEFN